MNFVISFKSCFSEIEDAEMVEEKTWMEMVRKNHRPLAGRYPSLNVCRESHPIL